MRLLFILSALLASSTITSLSAAPKQVEGFWTNQRLNLEVQVQRTGQGIRVLRVGQSRWRQYQRVRNDQYQDQEGNTYFMLSNGQLEWESFDGRKRIQFSRESSRGQSYNRNGKYTSGDRQRANRPRRLVRARDLQGTWINYWNDDCLLIRSRGGSLRVRGLGFGSRKFHPGPQGFEDHKGNVIRLDRRRLVLINRRGKIRGSFYRR